MLFKKPFSGLSWKSKGTATVGQLHLRRCCVLRQGEIQRHRPPGPGQPAGLGHGPYHLGLIEEPAFSASRWPLYATFSKAFCDLPSQIVIPEFPQHSPFSHNIKLIRICCFYRSKMVDYWQFHELISFQLLFCLRFMSFYRN